MAENTNTEKKIGFGRKILTLILTSPVNTLLGVALVYFAFQAYVLDNSPVLNQTAALGVICLWILWFVAKSIIKLLLVLLLGGFVVFSYYNYINQDANLCKQNGGVWNDTTKTCEEKTGWLHNLQEQIAKYLKN